MSFLSYGLAVLDLLSSGFSSGSAMSLPPLSVQCVAPDAVVYGATATIRAVFLDENNHLADPVSPGTCTFESPSRLPTIATPVRISQGVYETYHIVSEGGPWLWYWATADPYPSAATGSFVGDDKPF